MDDSRGGGGGCCFRVITQKQKQDTFRQYVKAQFCVKNSEKYRLEKHWVGHLLYTVFALRGGNLNKPIFKSSNARGVAGRMLIDAFQGKYQ